MNNEKLEAILKNHMPQAQVTISGDGHHFDAVIVCDDFLNQSRIQRHRLVYAALNPYIESGELHAFSMKTYTLQEWDTQHG